MIDYAATFTNYTGAFPDIEAVNVSAPGAGDGTEFVAALVNDIWGRAQALLDYAGLSPDGVQEAPDTAQILEAIGKGYGVGPGIGVIYWKNGTPATNGDRVILLQGQVIEIANYPLLAAAVYVGDANNPTAPAFYKTSDAGGVTRSTAVRNRISSCNRICRYAILSPRYYKTHTCASGCRSCTHPMSLKRILNNTP